MIIGLLGFCGSWYVLLCHALRYVTSLFHPSSILPAEWAGLYLPTKLQMIKKVALKPYLSRMGFADLNWLSQLSSKVKITFLLLLFRRSIGAEEIPSVLFPLTLVVGMPVCSTSSGAVKPF